MNRGLVVLAVLLLGGCSRSESSAPVLTAGDKIAVRTAPVAQEQQGRRLEVPATIRPAQRASIAAKVTGSVATFPGGLGQWVEAGEILLTLNAPEVAARVAQARARLAEAERTADRARALTEKGVDAPDTRRDAEDRLRFAAAGVAEAEAMADYVTIRAPFAGVITEKLVLDGDLATPGAPLLVLEATDRLRAEGMIPERAALTLRLGDAVTVDLEDGQSAVTGQLEELSPAADAATRSVFAKVALPAGAGRSGQFARLILPQGSVDALSVPVDAVTAFGQMERVFVVDQGRAALRLVKTGRTTQGRVEILAGLEAGETVVVAPGALRDGQPVTPQP